jgi:hypothetical protein
MRARKVVFTSPISLTVEYEDLLGFDALHLASIFRHCEGTAILETSGTTGPTTQRQIPEDLNFYSTVVGAKTLARRIIIVRDTAKFV